MAGIALATAWVNLAVSADGLPQQVARNFGVVDKIAADAGKRAGKVLADGVGSAKPNLSGLEAAVKRAGREAEQASKGVEAARHKESQATKLVEQRTKELAAATEKYGAGSSQVIGKQRQLSDATYKASLESQKLAVAVKESDDAQSKASRATKSLADAESKAAAGAKEYAGGIGKIRSAIDGLNTEKLRQAAAGVDWNQAKRGAAVVATGIGVAFAGATKTAADFEQRMSAVKAVSGATAPEMQQLHDKALQLGKDTAYSASESATAIEELVKAGVSVPQVMAGAADATVALASATGLDMPEAATLASNAMNAFGIEASKMTKVADLVAGASNASAIDAKEFGYSLQMVGAVANTAGMSLEDTTTAIAELGQAGIKGSDAGTSLKTMLLNLTPSTEKASLAMEQYGLMSLRANEAQAAFAKDGIKGIDTSSASAALAGLTKYYQKRDGLSKSAAAKEARQYLQENSLIESAFYDRAGKMRPLVEIQDALATSMKGLGKEEVLAAGKTMFGTDAVRAFAVMSKDGKKGAEDMAAAIGNVTAADTAAARMGNLRGKIEEMKGSFETLAIVIGEKFIPPVATAAEKVTGFVNAFLNMPTWVQGTIAGIALSIGAVAGAIAASIQVAQTFSAIQTAVGTYKELAAAMRGAAAAQGAQTAATNGGALAMVRAKAAMVAHKVASLASAAASKAMAAGQWLVNAAMAANPIGLVVLALVGLGAALVVAYKKSETFRRFVDGAFRGVKAIASSVTDWFTRTAAPALSRFFKGIGDKATDFASAVSGAWKATKGHFTAGLTWTRGTWAKGWSGVKGWISDPVGSGKKLAGKALTDTRSALSSLTSWGSGTWSKGWARIKSWLSSPVGEGKTAAGKALADTRGALSSALNWTRGTWSKGWASIKSWLSAPVDAGKAAAGKALTGTRSALSSAHSWARDTWSKGWASIKGWIASPVDSGKAAAGKSLVDARAALSSMSTWAGSTWKTGWAAVKGWITSPVDAAKTAIGTTIGSIKTAFSGMVTGIRTTLDGLRSAAAKPMNFIIGTAWNDGLRKALNAIPGVPDVAPSALIKMAEGGNVQRGKADSTKRPILWGEVPGVEEYYIPINGENRSRGLVMEAASKLGMGVTAMAKGGVVGGRGTWTPRFSSLIAAAAAKIGGMNVAKRGFLPDGGASGKSHRGDAIDAYGPGNLWTLRDALRSVGVASWVRGPKQGFEWHVHGVPMGPAYGQGAGSALYQAMDYAKGGNGLRGVGQPDPYAGKGSQSGPAGAVGSVGPVADEAGFLGKIKAVASQIGQMGSKFGPWGSTLAPAASNALSAAKSHGLEKIKSMIAGAAHNVASTVGSAKDWVAGKFKQGGGVEQWRGVATSAAKAAGLPLQYIDLLLQRMNVESGGNPNAQNNWDINARNGVPSQGLMQTIPPTFAAYAGPYRDRGIRDPFANIYAAIKYTLSRYGLKGIERAWGGRKGYATGTLSASPGLAWVGERGPEIVEFGGGERVYNAADSRRMMQSRPAAGGITSEQLTQALRAGWGGPVSVQVTDTDGALIGTMQGVARQEVDALAFTVSRF